VTNAQLYLAIALPEITLVIVLVVWLVQLSRLRRDIRSLRAELDDWLGKKPRPGTKETR
jgi:hypothetical protein